MKLFKNTFYLLSLCCISFLFSCEKGVKTELIYYSDDEGNDLYGTISAKLNIPSTPLVYDQTFPSYYGRSFTSYNNDMATLGRVIFYDKNLSHDRNISCASCHDQKLAFADAKAFSNGVHGRITSRNSLALGSVFSFREYYGDPSFGGVPFFWDNSANTVQEQSKRTFANEDEMNMKMPEVIERIKEESFYKPLFVAAYGSEEIGEDQVLDAVSEFVGAIGSYNSTYDNALENHFNNNSLSLTTIADIDFPEFSSAQNKGKNLYLSNCASCHGEINGLPRALKANNGLDLQYADTGIDEQSLFKVPTLRNIALTGPYMHDGRFNTLEEVVDHYNNNIKAHENLSDGLKDDNNQPKRLNFSSEDKSNLIAFMHTFTDEEFLTFEKYSDPFK